MFVYVCVDVFVSVCENLLLNSCQVLEVGCIFEYSLEETLLPASLCVQSLCFIFGRQPCGHRLDVKGLKNA